MNLVLKFGKEVSCIVQTENIACAEKTCTVCCEVLPNTEEYFYNRNKSKPELGLVAMCKKCCVNKSRKYAIKHENSVKEYKRGWCQRNKKIINQRCKDWRDQNREHFKKYTKEYWDNNRDRVNKYTKKWHTNKSHLISKIEWDDCKKYFDDACAYCGITENEHKEQFKQVLHKEHVVHTDSNHIDNCVPSCRRCNSTKWEHPMEEWYRKQEFFNNGRLEKIYKWLDGDYKIRSKE